MKVINFFLPGLCTLLRGFRDYQLLLTRAHLGLFFLLLSCSSPLLLEEDTFFSFPVLSVEAILLIACSFPIVTTSSGSVIKT